jgi:hypothetical protein
MFKILLAIVYSLTSVVFAGDKAVLTVTKQQFSALQFVYRHLQNPTGTTYQQWMHSFEPLVTKEQIVKIKKVFKSQESRVLANVEVVPKRDTIEVVERVGNTTQILVIFRGDPAIFGEFHGEKISWQEAMDMELFHLKIKKIAAKNKKTTAQSIYDLIIPSAHADGLLLGLGLIGGGIALAGFFISKSVTKAGKDHRAGMEEVSKDFESSAEKLSTSFKESVSGLNASISDLQKNGVGIRLPDDIAIRHQPDASLLINQINELIGKIQTYTPGSTEATFGITPRSGSSVK